jgi:4'-phosphopantetheinyl transferase
MNWPAAPAQFSLGSRDIHVWSAALRHSPERIAAYAGILSEDERGRAERFHFERDRSRFIAGRGVLRTILGRYLEREPAEIRFGYGARSKPFLADGASDIQFNLTHSDELALLAVTRLSSPGIDVERLRGVRDIEGIAARFFSASESDGLMALPDEQKTKAFFNLWTRKEAWLKATGEGISDSLNQVEVTFLAGEAARLTRLFGNEGAIADWWMQELEPVPDFVGALAIPARDVSVNTWKWE